METLPTLYKKTSTGKIQQWRIWVDGTTINSESGQTDGKKILSTDVIKRGKNQGRSNETTAAEQASLEAKSRHTKKLKAGYVLSIKDAQEEKTNAVIKGGYVPMTAKVYEDAQKHLKFPCAIQPKLDGIRACSTTTDAVPTVWTRTRKPIITVPHIVKALSTLPKYPWDGELYNHSYKDKFEEIVSMVKREKKLHPDHEVVEYHIYDVAIPGKTFVERVKILKGIAEKLPKDSPIKIVTTKKAKNETELNEIYQRFLDQGYEGAMARNLEGEYENKRSKHLLKMKIFMDAEFKVVDILEGRGKLAGCVGSFICEIDDEHGKRTFKAKAQGKLENLKTFFEDESTWKNKMMTVKFQDYSKANHVPRFPVGIRFRDGVDF